MGCSDITYELVALTKSSLQTAWSYTMPLATYRTYGLYRKPEGPRSRLDKWLRPFSPALSLAYLGVILIMTLALKVVQHVSCRAGLHDQGSSFCDCLLFVFEAICQQGHNFSPATNAGRLVILLAYMTAIVVNNSFSGILVSFYSYRGPSLPFSNLSVAIKEGYRLGVLNNSYYHDEIKNGIANNEVLSETGKHTIDVQPTILEGLNKACFDNYVFLAPIRTAGKFVGNLNCELLVMPISTQQLVVPVRKGSPYLKIFNNNLLKLRESGVAQRILCGILRRKEVSRQGRSDAWDGVGWREVASFLLVLATASAASLLVLLCELCLDRVRPGSREALVILP
ncbi:glutamate receptor ionotropic, kainate 2-like [Bacillus rossius redtenbacheri]|uniref:glutamate receptor ionotropic, kainate 2-like n=1 Tax=Bacillus rossius redtenbacheri TaxID=93214 RepID=UPI002FDD4FA9